MEKIKEKINFTFQQLFNMPKHPFFIDIDKVNLLANNYIKHQELFIRKKIKHEKLDIPYDFIYPEKNYKILSLEELKKLNNEIEKNTSKKKILQIVSKLSEYLIKSNIDNYSNLFSKFRKDKDKINICIIGAGPIGLYLACYLDYYYNKGTLNQYPKVNIIIFDNRINKAKLRKPYSRHRPFATSSPLLSLILPKIYTLNSDKNLLHINIYVLEYLLLSQVLLKYNIPIIFEDYDWNDYKNIFEIADIDVVFDCSGGRLETDIFNNINTKWIDKIKKVDKNINKQLLVNKKTNLIHLIDYPVDKKFKINHFYGSLLVYNSDRKFISKFDIDINNENDLSLLNKIKKKYYTYTNTIKLLHNIKDDTDRNFLYSILFDNKNKYNKYLFTFDVWSIYIRHSIQPAEIFTHNKKKILYIGTGDTIFHSHFITGAGLNRTLKFTIKCANFLSNYL